MPFPFSRRQFLSTSAKAGALSLAIPGISHLGNAFAAESPIQFGYASITWGGNDHKAIEDISSLGFPGIQLRSNVLEEFRSKPAALRDLLAQHKLRFVALSSGSFDLEKPGTDEDQLKLHASNAKFVRDAGGSYLQILDNRPKSRAISDAEFSRLGKLLTELGKRTADVGIPLGYHNHMGSLSEKPDEFEKVLAESDPRYVKLELDIAHCAQGGGDPVKVIQQHGERLLFLHVKDVETFPAGSQRFRFVELGRGRVDIPGVFKELNARNFKGWAVIELDEVPDKSRTPKEAAAINKAYVEQKLGFTI